MHFAANSLSEVLSVHLVTTANIPLEKTSMEINNQLQIDNEFLNKSDSLRILLRLRFPILVIKYALKVDHRVGLLSSAGARVMNSKTYHFEEQASARCHTQHGRHQGYVVSKIHSF